MMTSGNIAGLGMDIIEIERIKSALSKQPRFILRVFTASEREYFTSRGNNPSTIAGCFAAKEAAVKSVGGGFITDVELSWSKTGQPSLTMRGKEDLTFFVTITHSKEYAAATVVAVES